MLGRFSLHFLGYGRPAAHLPTRVLGTKICHCDTGTGDYDAPLPHHGMWVFQWRCTPPPRPILKNTGGHDNEVNTTSLTEPPCAPVARTLVPTRSKDCGTQPTANHHHMQHWHGHGAEDRNSIGQLLFLLPNLDFTNCHFGVRYVAGTPALGKPKSQTLGEHETAKMFVAFPWGQNSGHDNCGQIMFLRIGASQNSLTQQLLKIVAGSGRRRSTNFKLSH